ncbi:MAG: DegT/DnrJ/EryC1/StrS family aminotransferase [Vampirovibrionales bacterium]|nr:DegT/DnrJ/EryC1/StrS family aminotransferase [Vampirovibrionales bacterium]
MTVIPILNLTRQYESLQAELSQAVTQVAAGGVYILGENVKKFEEEMAAWLGVKHVVGCASGTDALYLALKALKIGTDNNKPGYNYMVDEVITTAFTFVATSESIIHAGAKPVFVDVDPETYNLDAEQVEAAITPNTKAIMPVHLYGQPCDMAALKAIADKHKLAIIEDCAQAVGAKFDGKSVGGIGDIGCFSFFPSKNLGAMGDAGMATTNDDELAARLRMLRVHGSRQRYYHEESGLNSRLDEIQAAALRIKLKHIASWNERRREVAAYYNDLLKPLSATLQTPVIAEQCLPVFHQYTVKLKLANAPGDQKETRNDLQKKMLDAGVQTMIYYPVPQYRQQSHAFLNLPHNGFLPVTEAVCDQVLSLPMFPEITKEEQETVVEALKKALETLPVAAI